jgi:hypothetical protein
LNEELVVEPTSPNQAHTHARVQQQVVYETACALAESATLVEAAPRMLQAICSARGWEYGALWTVDYAAARLRVAATWHATSLRLASVCDSPDAIPSNVSLLQRLSNTCSPQPTIPD